MNYNESIKVVIGESPIEGLTIEMNKKNYN